MRSVKEYLINCIIELFNIFDYIVPFIVFINRTL